MANENTAWQLEDFVDSLVVDLDKTLANQIQKSRRSQNPPKVGGISLSLGEDDKPYLLIEGKNLAVDPAFRPVAVVNQALAEVLSSSDTEMKIQISADHGFAENNE